MKKLKEIFSYLKNKITNPLLFFPTIIFFFLSWIFSSLHYKNIYYGNNLSWITWLLALLFFIFCFFNPKKIFKKNKFNFTNFLIFIFVSFLYWSTHLWNFSSAPWNINGLFDDAAWDIYFAKNHIFNGTPFQSAFFDTIGYISREVVFHYYISTFFKLFGYNLLIFNISLLVLGFITVITTTFIVRHLFKNFYLTIIFAFLINFFPLHYLHIFMGHRYAICVPLMVSSLYFLYTGFSCHSPLRMILSALFAALCWNSGIMGKQFILGLILAAFLKILFDKRIKNPSTISLALIWGVGFIISATPLLVYIIFNYPQYTLRERSLSSEFFTSLKNYGFLGIIPYLHQLKRLFFTKYDLKMFLPGFYPIPFSYYFLIIPGLLFAFLKGHWEIIFLSFIPIVASLIAGSYDFRVLLAFPAWLIAIAFSLDYLFKIIHLKDFWSKLTFLITIIFLLTGLVPSVIYLWKASKNPNFLYLLPHKDVAVSRLFQDIVEDKENPSNKMKTDEFNRKIDISSLSSDTFICPFGAYAIAHLYLQDYNDKKILSFCNQGIQILKTPKEILNDNLKTLLGYQPTNKDLKLVWEISEKSKPIIEIFKPYHQYGEEEIISGEIDGNKYSLYILTIKNHFISQFQKEIIKKINDYQNVF